MSTEQLPARIRLARQQRGLSRRDVASHLKVDVTSIAAWETGRYLPRDNHRAALAKLLGIDFTALITDNTAMAGLGISASPVHGSRAGQVLTDLAQNCSEKLSIMRVTSPIPRPKHFMRDFREIVARRLREGSLEVRVIEIFYGLERLQEALSNIFRYGECRYHLKTFAIVSTEVFPGIDIYTFDRDQSVLNSYWSAPSTDERPVMQISGEPFSSFLREYWNEAWRRAISLNPCGTQDLCALQEIADRMGVSGAAWDQLVEKARDAAFGESTAPLP